MFMARPALSAARTTDILDLFAAFPGRAFTMSEIIRATGINVASCHAVLSVLAQRGYLSRRDGDKTYMLGPALLCVGQAAFQALPLAVRAQEAAARLFQDLQIPVLLSTIAGDEILALSAFSTSDGRSTGLRAGQRVPLIPPNGAHFLAWAGEPEIAAWLARSGDQDEAKLASLRTMLALVRRRGFQVTLRTASKTELALLMAQMAAGQPPLDYKLQVAHALSDESWPLSQPETINPGQSYDIVLIAASIFDRDGQAYLSLGLGGFAGPVDGQTILELSAHLLEACLRVMREQRAS
jgi:DNA-binding IclR family transcriptional regulator